VPFLVTVLVLFQSHWLDDILTGEADAAGIAVSAVGSLLLLTGLISRRLLAGRVILTLALLFVVFVSVADLVGMKPDGSRTSNVLHHWSSDLGWTLTLTVAATLICAVLSLSCLFTGRLEGHTAAAARDQHRIIHE
jgi:hypothetical protein